MHNHCRAEPQAESEVDGCPRATQFPRRKPRRAGPSSPAGPFLRGRWRKGAQRRTLIMEGGWPNAGLGRRRIQHRRSSGHRRPHVTKNVNSAAYAGRCHPLWKMSAASATKRTTNATASGNSQSRHAVLEPAVWPRGGSLVAAAIAAWIECRRPNHPAVDGAGASQAHSTANMSRASSRARMPFSAFGEALTMALESLRSRRGVFENDCAEFPNRAADTFR